MTPPQASGARKRILVFIVAYNAERTIQDVVRRIPSSLSEHDTEILIIDDSSQDETFARAQILKQQEALAFPLTVLFNPVNQGYGGNQKIGFHYAIEKEFDYVALVHGDGQYALERLPELLQPLVRGTAHAVFGSRMMRKGEALKGGMPRYKYLGNRVLTGIQNRLLGSALSEFHSGYRIYSTHALRAIPFDRNTNDFHFDTEIIIQLMRAGARIEEVPIPTYYGDEICHVNGLKYAWHVVTTTLLCRIQDLGILYNRKFDVLPADHSNPLYQSKFGYESPHTLAVERVQAESSVLDIGCASGYVSKALKRKHCRITGIDQFPVSPDAELDRFVQHNLDRPDLPVDVSEYDYVLLLDVIEHLRSPEQFMEGLRRSIKKDGDTAVIISTGNVAFCVTRFMLLLGFFNYGSRGILDLTHTRLFTFGSLQRLLEQAGYTIAEVRGIPAPFPLALGDGILGKAALALNKLLVRLSKSLFSYQMFMVARPNPSLPWLLAKAYQGKNIAPKTEPAGTNDEMPRHAGLSAGPHE